MSLRVLGKKSEWLANRSLIYMVKYWSGAEIRAKSGPVKTATELAATALYRYLSRPISFLYAHVRTLSRNWIHGSGYEQRYESTKISGIDIQCCF